MRTLTINWLKNKDLLVFETITGSKAYGLDTPASDTDIRGVFVLPKSSFYSLDYTKQVSNESNDIVYYELKRFMELLARNNPNILELLSMPEDCILYKDEVMRTLQSGMFLSKLCEKTFANYAFAQIKKAYGLEKKIVNPMEKERKTVLDFCFVYINDQSMALNDFLQMKELDQSKMGLSALPHLRDCYNLFYTEHLSYAGIVKKTESDDVCVSNIPKGERPIAMLYFNKDGYSVYCKRYHEYWNWVATRNEDRFNTTMAHGKKYDSKNMMHVFRLLLMAKEIATENRLFVRRSDREFLLNIKQGKYEYDELVQKAEQLRDELPALYEKADLPDEPNMIMINGLLAEMRDKYYKSNSKWQN